MTVREDLTHDIDEVRARGLRPEFQRQAAGS